MVSPIDYNLIKIEYVASSVSIEIPFLTKYCKPHESDDFVLYLMYVCIGTK